MLDDGEAEVAAEPPKQFKASISGTQQKTAKWFMAMLDAEYTIFEFKVKHCFSQSWILIKCIYIRPPCKNSSTMSS